MSKRPRRAVERAGWIGNGWQRRLASQKIRLPLRSTRRSQLEEPHLPRSGPWRWREVPFSGHRVQSSTPVHDHSSFRRLKNPVPLMIGSGHMFSKWSSLFCVDGSDCGGAGQPRAPRTKFVAAPLSPLSSPWSSGWSSATWGGCFQARAAPWLYPRSTCLASGSHWLDVAGSSPASHHAAEAFGYLPSPPASSVCWPPRGRSGSRCQRQCGRTRAPCSKHRTLSSN